MFGLRDVPKRTKDAISANVSSGCLIHKHETIILILFISFP